MDNRIATGMDLWGTGAFGINLTQTQNLKPWDSSFNCTDILFIAQQQSCNRWPWIHGLFFFFLSLLTDRLLQTWINQKLYNPGNSIWAGLKRQLWTTRADSALPSEKAVTPCRHKCYPGGWKQHFLWFTVTFGYALTFTKAQSRSFLSLTSNLLWLLHH